MPNYYSDQPFQQSYNYLDQAASSAMPSPESRDRAYARVRSRLSGERNTRDQELGDQYAGRGQTNSGGYDQAKERSYGQYLSNYGSGMSELEDNYEKQRMEGAKTLQGVGTAYGNVANDQASRGIDQGLGNEKLRIDDYNSQSQRLGSLNDIFTSIGTVGGALGAAGSPRTGDAFDNFKQYLLGILGINY